MLSAPSQVLIRNRELFNEGRWALVNPQDSAIFKELSNASLTGFHQFFDIFKQATNTSPQIQHHFAAAFEVEDKLDGAVVYMPKAKQHARMLLANIAACVKPGGLLLLVGDNKAGVKSAAKLLDGFGAQVNKVDSARHCSLFAVEIADGIPEFSISDWETQYPITSKGTQIKVVSLPGVFSHGELDAGTSLLLDNVDAIKGGELLDFACGAGVIGVMLAKQAKENQVNVTLTMSDVSALAVHCAKRTASVNDINATVLASDGLTEISGKFDSIYTNPPFHTGIKTDYSVTEGFIRQLSQHMTPGASLLLVANRFLKYPDFLDAAFGATQTVAQTNKFSLYLCHKRAR